MFHLHFFFIFFLLSFYFFFTLNYLESGTGSIVEVYLGDKYEEKDILPDSLPFSGFYSSSQRYIVQDIRA